MQNDAKFNRIGTPVNLADALPIAFEAGKNVVIPGLGDIAPGLVAPIKITSLSGLRAFAKQAFQLQSTADEFEQRWSSIVRALEKLNVKQGTSITENIQSIQADSKHELIRNITSMPGDEIVLDQVIPAGCTIYFVLAEDGLTVKITTKNVIFTLGDLRRAILPEATPANVELQKECWSVLAPVFAKQLLSAQRTVTETKVLLPITRKQYLETLVNFQCISLEETLPIVYELLHEHVYGALDWDHPIAKKFAREIVVSTAIQIEVLRSKSTVSLEELLNSLLPRRSTSLTSTENPHFTEQANTAYCGRACVYAKILQKTGKRCSPQTERDYVRPAMGMMTHLFPHAWSEEVTQLDDVLNFKLRPYANLQFQSWSEVEAAFSIVENHVLEILDRKQASETERQHATKLLALRKKTFFHVVASAGMCAEPCSYALPPLPFTEERKKWKMDSLSNQDVESLFLKTEDSSAYLPNGYTADVPKNVAALLTSRKVIPSQKQFSTWTELISDIGAQGFTAEELQTLPIDWQNFLHQENVILEEKIARVVRCFSPVLEMQDATPQIDVVPATRTTLLPQAFAIEVINQLQALEKQYTEIVQLPATLLLKSRCSHFAHCKPITDTFSMQYWLQKTLDDARRFNTAIVKKYPKATINEIAIVAKTKQYSLLPVSLEQVPALISSQAIQEWIIDNMPNHQKVLAKVDTTVRTCPLAKTEVQQLFTVDIDTERGPFGDTLWNDICVQAALLNDERPTALGTGRIEAIFQGHVDALQTTTAFANKQWFSDQLIILRDSFLTLGWRSINEENDLIAILAIQAEALRQDAMKYLHKHDNPMPNTMTIDGLPLVTHSRMGAALWDDWQLFQHLAENTTFDFSISVRSDNVGESRAVTPCPKKRHIPFAYLAKAIGDNWKAPIQPLQAAFDMLPQDSLGIISTWKELEIVRDFFEKALPNHPEFARVWEQHIIPAVLQHCDLPIDGESSTARDVHAESIEGRGVLKRVPTFRAAFCPIVEKAINYGLPQEWQQPPLFDISSNERLTSWQDVETYLKQARTKLENSMGEKQYSSAMQSELQRYFEWKSNLFVSFLENIVSFEDSAPPAPNFAESVDSNVPFKFLSSSVFFTMFEKRCTELRQSTGQVFDPMTLGMLADIRSDARLLSDLFTSKAEVFDIAQRMLGKMNKASKKTVIARAIEEVTNIFADWEFADDPSIEGLVSNNAVQQITLSADEKPKGTMLPFEANRDYVSELSTANASLATTLENAATSVSGSWPCELISNSKATTALRAEIVVPGPSAVQSQVEKSLRQELNDARAEGKALHTTQHLACWMLRRLHWISTLEQIPDLAPENRNAFGAWYREQICSAVGILPSTAETEPTTAVPPVTIAVTDSIEPNEPQMLNESMIEVDPLEEAFALCGSESAKERMQLMANSCLGIASEFGLELRSDAVEVVQNWFSGLPTDQMPQSQIALRRLLLRCAEETTLSPDTHFIDVLRTRLETFAEPINLLQIGHSWSGVLPVSAPEPHILPTEHREFTPAEEELLRQLQVEAEATRVITEKIIATDNQAETMLPPDTGSTDTEDQLRSDAPFTNEAQKKANDTTVRLSDKLQSPREPAPIVRAPRLAMTVPQLISASRSTLLRIQRELRVTLETHDAAQDPEEIARIEAQQEAVLLALQALLSTLRH